MKQVAAMNRALEQVGHVEVQTSVTPEQLRDLMKKTDLRRLTNRMEELAEPVGTQRAEA
jgi:hypothetical protein